MAHYTQGVVSKLCKYDYTTIAQWGGILCTAHCAQEQTVQSNLLDRFLRLDQFRKGRIQ